MRVVDSRRNGDVGKLFLPLIVHEREANGLQGEGGGEEREGEGVGILDPHDHLFVGCEEEHSLNPVSKRLPIAPRNK